ncbi:unnamed protein product [Sympodiomycopsis kandeliae]
MEGSSVNLHVHPSSVIDQSLSEQVSQALIATARILTKSFSPYPNAYASLPVLYSASQLLPEHHQSSVPSLLESPVPACDEHTTQNAYASGEDESADSPTLADSLQPSEGLEKELDEVANLLAQQPRVDGGPRRPMNAFLIFARWRRMQMAQTRIKLPTKSQEGSSTVTNKNAKRKHSQRKAGPKPAEVSAALGEEWKSLSQEQQAPFHQKATQLRADFDRKNPEYKFTRGSKGCAKKRRQEAMELKALARQAQRQGKALKSCSVRESGRGKGGSASSANQTHFSPSQDASSQERQPEAPFDAGHHSVTLEEMQQVPVSDSHDSALGDLPSWSPRKGVTEMPMLGRSPQLWGHHRRVSENNNGGIINWRPSAGANSTANYTWQYVENESDWNKNIHIFPDAMPADRQLPQHHYGHPFPPMGANYQVPYGGGIIDGHAFHEHGFEAAHQPLRNNWMGNAAHHNPHAPTSMHTPQYSNMFASAPPTGSLGGPSDTAHWRQEGPYEYEYPQTARPAILPAFETSPRSYSMQPSNSVLHIGSRVQPHGFSPLPKNIYNHPQPLSSPTAGGHRPGHRNEDNTLRHRRGKSSSQQAVSNEADVLDLKPTEFNPLPAAELNRNFAPHSQEEPAQASPAAEEGNPLSSKEEVFPETGKITADGPDASQIEGREGADISLTSTTL